MEKLHERAIRFIENLTLVGDNSGQTVELLMFQKQILKLLFATDRTGKRKINRAFLMLPRKQAKTFLAAAIVVLWLLGLGKQGQQVLSIANDKTQATLLYDMAKQIIEADHRLSALANPVKAIKRLTVESKHSFYQALSSESKTKTGYSPSLVIVDEFQDITDPDLIKNITTGFGAREDYLTLFICTAGTRKDTPCYQEYEYAKAIKAGTIKNPKYAAIIYETPEDADWTDEAVWKKAMPAYGKFCKAATIRDEFELAKRLRSKENEFRQYYLNQWQIGGGHQWIKDSDWMANNSMPLGDAEEYTAGVDLASVVDTSSLVLFGKNSSGLYDVIPFVWVCEAQVDKRKTAEFDYRRWAEDGLLRVTPGNAQDQELIFNDICQILTQYNVTKICIDRHGTQWMGPKMIAAGLPVEGMGQGYVSMSEPLKQIERLALEHLLAHGGNEVMRWMASNSRLVPDSKENYRVEKRDREKKVDGIIALAMAVAVYPFETEFTSVYERGGLFI